MVFDSSDEVYVRLLRDWKIYAIGKSCVAVNGSIVVSILSLSVLFQYFFLSIKQMYYKLVNNLAHYQYG